MIYEMAAAKELVKLAMFGDRGAFAELARRERGNLLALGRKWFADEYLAEEVAQETLIRAFEGIVGLRHPEAFGGWLTTIARNVARARWRSRQRTTELALDTVAELGADDPVGTIALRDAVLRAQQALTPGQRSIAELCLVEGYSTAEAARHLSLPPAVVKGRLQRARQNLREELRDIMPTKREVAPTAPEPGLLVLIVDDEAHIARLIQVNLEIVGYETMTAIDGIEALERLDVRTPDLITLDLMMPRMDGWDVLKGIRSRAETLLTPVFILSALPQSDPRNGICNELADAYIQKPFSPPELIAMIDRRLGHLNTEQRQDVLQWRKMRFGGELTAQVAAEHLAGHYVGIQKEAYGVLAEMGAAAIPALTQVATSEAESGWFYALQLLGSRKEEEATLALAKLLTHPDRQRRWAALATIGALSADGALQAVVEHGQPVFDEIVAALDSPDERLQAEAIRTLQRIRTPEAMRTLQDFAGRVSGAALELAAMALRWMGRA